MKTLEAPKTLGVYADLVYSRDAGELRANMAFGLYLAALAERVDRLVIFGREATGDAAGSCVHTLRGDFEFVPLPYYASVADVREVYKSMPDAMNAFEAKLKGLDAVWLFGPHPVSLRFVEAAQKAGVPVVLGVRQDQPAYMRTRLKGLKRLFGVPYFDRLEAKYRDLAGELPTIVAGKELADVYGGPPNVRPTAFSLVRDDAIAEIPVAGSNEDHFQLISVGRIDPEKNPLLLPRILAELVKRRPGTDWRLRVVGEGPLESELAAEAARAGVSDRIELLGYVPFGPKLQELYESSDLMLHVSHTEGLPQVLIEAMAVGLPMVATDVGGVGAAVALSATPLVPPNDAGRAAAAVIEMAEDPARRKRCAELGLTRAAELTIETQQAEALGHMARHYELGGSV